MNKILELAKKRSDQADILDLEWTRSLVGFENSKLKTVDLSKHRGVALRVFVNGKIGCLVYPKKNQEDIRKDYCDHGFECKTLKEFKSWSKQKQEAFLKFLKQKDLDFYEYSIKMDNGELLEEFKKNSEEE